MNVGRNAIDSAFENSMKGASIRRLFVDLYCSEAHGDVTSLWDAEENIPHDFLVQW